MDITTIGKNGYKIKGKVATVLVEDRKVKIDSEKEFVIDAPGEYEVKGVSVVSVQDAQGTIYIVEMDSMRTCFIDGVAEKLNEIQIEEIGAVDIAVMSKYHVEQVKQIDPWVILTESGAEDSAVPIAKYSITSDRLPTETQTIVLERKG